MMETSASPPLSLIPVMESVLLCKVMGVKGVE